MAIQKGHGLPEAALPRFCMAAPALALACAASGAAAAETSHGAHEHGTAELELAVEGSNVVVNFASPMYNLVGFEHAPRDEQDREAVAAARALLDDVGNLVLLDAEAACTVVGLDVHWDMPAAAEEEHDDDEVDEHDAHESHADEHDAHDADAHDADDHDDHDAGEQHADVTVEIRYACEHADRLNALDIAAFESFERLSEIELRAVGPGGAVAEHPESDSPRVDLRGLFGR